MMNTRIPIVVMSLTFLIASCKQDRYSPSKYLSNEAQRKFIRESVYYGTKLPPNGSEETKFDPEFDWYYDAAADETTLLKYFIADDGSQYFLMGRKARSLTPMQEGIGGIVRYDPSGKMSSYEEVFRMWKMAEDTLVVRGALLFDRMVRGKDLSLYYSKFQMDRYIEFPDDRFFYDKPTRHWRDRALDSLRIQ